MAKQPSNKEFPKKTTNIRQASDTEQVLFQRTENLLENIEQTIVGALSNIFFIVNVCRSFFIGCL